jgi:aminoglycoside 6'-N-acetyltransferase
VALPTLQGERLVLRPATPDDAEAIAAILAEPDVAPWWGDYSVEEVLEELPDSYAIVVDGAVAGWLQVHEETDPEYPSVAFDIGVTGALRGRGYGREALIVAIRHFVARGHHRFTIDPAAANARAIRAYAAVGFKPVGIRRDGLLMDMLARELVDTGP